MIARTAADHVYGVDCAPLLRRTRTASSPDIVQWGHTRNARAHTHTHTPALTRRFPLHYISVSPHRPLEKHILPASITRPEDKVNETTSTQRSNPSARQTRDTYTHALSLLHSYTLTALCQTRTCVYFSANPLAQLAAEHALGAESHSMTVQEVSPLSELTNVLILCFTNLEKFNSTLQYYGSGYPQQQGGYGGQPQQGVSGHARGHGVAKPYVPSSCVGAAAVQFPITNCRHPLLNYSLIFLALRT